MYTSYLGTGSPNGFPSVWLQEEVWHSSATWLAHEVLQHYLREGSKPIEWSSIVLRRLTWQNLTVSSPVSFLVFQQLFCELFAFTMRSSRLGLDGEETLSGTFSISNGTRQGSVSSPSFWAIYLNPLLEELRASGVGCYVAGVFMVVYADDCLLLAPSRKAAQLMLSIFERFAEENNIRFSTHPDPSKSKSEAMYVVGPRQNVDPPVPLLVW